ncbi:MAG: hypothetical protein RL732_599 [Bacteroidota bacterium]
MMGLRSMLLTALLVVDLAQAQGPFQLAPPLLKASSLFYTESAEVTMAFAHPGAAIRYSFVHEQPGPDDSVYTKPLVVTAPMATLYARSYAAGYLPSDAASLTLIKDGLPLATVNATPPHPRYPGSGPSTLYDNRGGTPSIGSPDWLGYDVDSIDLWINLHSAQSVKKVLLDFLQNEDSWVFLPGQVIAYGITRQGPVELARQAHDPEVYHPGSRCVPLVLKLAPQLALDQLHIIIKGIKQLPAWHSGKGQHAWVFIDEIKIY